MPWLYNQSDNTYYQDHTGDYPLRYHPITLYSMGLLSKDQYGTKFKIFNVGTDGQIKDSGVNISKTAWRKRMCPVVLRRQGAKE